LHLPRPGLCMRVRARIERIVTTSLTESTESAESGLVASAHAVPAVVSGVLHLAKILPCVLSQGLPYYPRELRNKVKGPASRHLPRFSGARLSSPACVVLRSSLRTHVPCSDPAIACVSAGVALA
jgi:hypothetical protein